MKILFIISSLSPGGAEKQTIIDANLFSENHDVTLISFKEGELKSLLKEKVNLIFVTKRGYLKTASRIRKLIIENKIQVINASLFSSMIIAVLSSKKTDVPVIWYFHSHEYDIPLKSKIALKYFSKNNSLRKIYFVNNELRSYFNEKGFNFPENKQDILFNTYTVSPEKKVKERDPENEIVIGFIGRLVDLKRVEYLIETSVYLNENGIRNYRMDIIGDGEMKNKLMNYANAMGVEDKINFLGFRSDVEKYYDTFDLFVMPSREECLSIALIDACVKSIPSIAFDVGGNGEIISDNETGYLVKSKEELFEKIKILLIDKKKRMDFGISAQRNCICKFDKIKRYKYLENIFKELN